MKTSSCAPLGKHAALPLLILALLAGIWSVTFHVIGHERATAHLVANAAEASTLLLVILGWTWYGHGARARWRMRRMLSMYAAASEANMDACFMLRALLNKNDTIGDFKVIALNPRAQQLTRCGKQELMKHTLCGWLPEARHNGVLERLARICAEGGAFQGDMQNLMPQFAADWLHWQVVAVEGGVVITARDISERMRNEARIVHLAHHDALTGLPNRSLIADRLHQAVLQAERHGQSVLVAFIDLDNFKLVNDTLGHNAGDALLRVVAGRMVDCVRRNDTVGRFGGDEFVMVLPHVDQNPAALAPLLEKVLAAVVQPVTLEGQRMQVSCSIGAAIYPRDGRDADALMLHADMAMYRAKQGGRNNCQFYNDEMNARLGEKLALTEELRKALERGQLSLVYQPKVELHSGRVFGVEALLRWHHPERGSISPGQFIPLAEQSNLIVPIGEWALREACRQARAWQDQGVEPLSVSVNVSPRQFEDVRLVARVQDALRDNGLDARWLELEVTESLIMRDVAQSVARMRELEAMGISLAIDDFGTGYSSLASLKTFPIRRLKIDQSFVRDLASNADDRAIVRTVIALSHQLRLRVIAEGVETEQQRCFLLHIGCDEVQGYLFGKPLPAAELGALLPRADAVLLHA